MPDVFLLGTSLVCVCVCVRVYVCVVCEYTEVGVPSVTLHGIFYVLVVII